MLELRWIGRVGVCVLLTMPCVAQSTRVQDALITAESLLGHDQAEQAISKLEALLAEARGVDRTQAMALLRRALSRAAEQAEAAGKTRLAADHRANLAILNRKSARQDQDTQPPADVKSGSIARPDLPKPPEALPAPELSAPRALDTQSTRDPEVLRVSADPAPIRESERDAPAVIDRETTTAPPPNPKSDTAASLMRADAAFRDKRYDDAGAIYDSLHKDGALPGNRIDAYAYCRRHALVGLINKRPRTSAEWEAIERELAAIRTLTPGHWYDEYLGNRLDELKAATKSSAAAASSGRSRSEAEAGRRREPLARYGSPNEADRAGSITDHNRPPEPAPQAKTPAADVAGGIESWVERPETMEALVDQDSKNWQVLKTANFQIYHDDLELARRVAVKAEEARRDALQHWGGEPAQHAWTPRCFVYLFPTAEIFARVTGQSPRSPGFSTTGEIGGRVTSRRINLRADHEKLLDAVLPHEVTHVVLADIFCDVPIPRWADEGMAALAEPEHEQALRARDLIDQLREHQIYDAKALMLMDYPEETRWPLYYAQSVSLTRFLVKQRDAATFVAFLKAIQRGQLEAELRRFYGFGSFEELQDHWLAGTDIRLARDAR